MFVLKNDALAVMFRRGETDLSPEINGICIISTSFESTFSHNLGFHQGVFDAISMLDVGR